jgi:hypothetical protein
MATTQARQSVPHWAFVLAHRLGIRFSRLFLVVLSLPETAVVMAG